MWPTKVSKQRYFVSKCTPSSQRCLQQLMGPDKQKPGRSGLQDKKYQHRELSLEHWLQKFSIWHFQQLLFDLHYACDGTFWKHSKL